MSAIYGRYQLRMEVPPKHNNLGSFILKSSHISRQLIPSSTHDIQIICWTQPHGTHPFLQLSFTYFRMLAQNRVQTFPLQALLKPKTRSQLVQLFHLHASKQLCKLLRKRLRQERLQRRPYHMPLRRPWRRIRLFCPRTHLINPLHQRSYRLLRLLTRVLPPRIKLQPLLLLQPRRNPLYPRTFRIAIHHTLHPNILIQPDRPWNLILIIYLELRPEQIIPLLVNLRRVLVTGVRVHGAELAVPGWDFLFVHELALP